MNYRRVIALGPLIVRGYRVVEKQNRGSLTDMHLHRCTVLVEFLDDWRRRISRSKLGPLDRSRKRRRPPLSGQCDSEEGTN